MKYLFIREEIYSNELMTKLIFNSEKELLKYLKENWEHIFNYGFSSSRIIMERLRVGDKENEI